ncbi:MbtH family NRPS accessory protein [Actinoplanes sp. NPDC051346]|uniref:MbtH family protein n=1 Tax=Actinoplanes sp. NPDC051346 TaxID=3155048 RepID=UPI0034495997
MVTANYLVVVNDEGQYSIWPQHRDLPEGWYAEGTSGLQDVCLARVAAVWTDMRPASVRTGTVHP